MDPYTNFCSKKIHSIFWNDVLFGTWKSEIYFIVIYLEYIILYYTKIFNFFLLIIFEPHT